MRKYSLKIDNLRFMKNIEEAEKDPKFRTLQVEKINDFISKSEFPCDKATVISNLTLKSSTKKNLFVLEGYLEVTDVKDLSLEVFENMLVNYISNYLNILFLTLNLSNCGILSFVHSQVIINDKVKTKLHFDSDIFGGGYDLSNEGNWFDIYEIEYIKTYKWLLDIGIGTKQVATNKVMRAVFSLSNCAIESGFNYSSIIWLSLGLESILSLGKHNILDTLRKRSFLVLGEPQSHKKEIKKMINAFYEIRSNYVHGEIIVDNGLKNDNIDEQVHNIGTHIMENSDVGSMLLIGIIQKMIISNWTSLSFTENFLGQINPIA